MDRFVPGWDAVVTAAPGEWTATRLPSSENAVPALYRVDHGTPCPSIVAAVITYQGTSDPIQLPDSAEALENAALAAAEFRADSAEIANAETTRGSLKFTGVCGNGSKRSSALLTVISLPASTAGAREALYTLVTGVGETPTTETLALRDALAASWSAAPR